MNCLLPPSVQTLFRIACRAFAAALCFASAGDAAELTPAEIEFRTALGREAVVLPLWPEGKVPDEPGSIGAEFTQPSKSTPDIMMIQNVTRPSLTILSPPKDKNTGVALVIGPGGGYGGLAYRDVIDVARVMNPRGITVVLLKYRVPKRNQGFAMNHQPLQDAQRAMGILRTRGAEWGIAPDKIGIGGFSAGGHLAASLANHHERRTYAAVDAADLLSCRPDFCVLLCPAYLTDPIDSRTPDAKLNYAALSPAKTPPTFIAITEPDRFMTGATEYMLALTRAKVNAEFHIYPTGSHSTGIARDWIDDWSAECHRWLGDAGFLGAKPKPEPMTYASTKLTPSTAPDGLTEADWALRRILRRDCPVIPLWPEGRGPDETLPPSTTEVVSTKSRGGNALNVTQVVRPTLTVVAPTRVKPTGRAVIVAPGGGYGALAAEHEGTRVAEWLNEQGITALVLKYRVPARAGQARDLVAQQDLQRAMRITRARATEWGIDPRKIGVLGFSAGGHAVTLLAATFERPAYPPRDEIDRASCRPDFALPIYAAYLTEPTDSDAVVANLKSGLKRDHTPPLFFAVAKDDRFSRGVMNYYLDVRAAEVPAECHVYNAGGHGGGIDPVSYPTSEWTRAAERWLKALDRPADAAARSSGE